MRVIADTANYDQPFKQEMLEEGTVEGFIPSRAFIDKLIREKGTTMQWNGKRLVQQPAKGADGSGLDTKIEAPIQRVSEKRREKRIVLGAGAAGFGLWGVMGLWIGGWKGAGMTLVIVGLVGCVAFTFGSLWRYLTLDEEFTLPTGKLPETDPVEPPL